MTNIFMFSGKWLKDNNTEKPTAVDTKTEGYATHNAMGTGPFKLESRVADSKTVLVVNDLWWDEKKHNLDRIEYMPIASAAIRSSTRAMARPYSARVISGRRRRRYRSRRQRPRWQPL